MMTPGLAAASLEEKRRKDSLSRAARARSALMNALTIKGATASTPAVKASVRAAQKPLDLNQLFSPPAAPGITAQASPFTPKVPDWAGGSPAQYHETPPHWNAFEETVYRVSHPTTKFHSLYDKAANDRLDEIAQHYPNSIVHAGKVFDDLNSRLNLGIAPETRQTAMRWLWSQADGPFDVSDDLVGKALRLSTTPKGPDAMLGDVTSYKTRRGDENDTLMLKSKLAPLGIDMVSFNVATRSHDLFDEVPETTTVRLLNGQRIPFRQAGMAVANTLGISPDELMRGQLAHKNISRLLSRYPDEFHSDSTMKEKLEELGGRKQTLSEKLTGGHYGRDASMGFLSPIMSTVDVLDPSAWENVSNVLALQGEVTPGDTDFAGRMKVLGGMLSPFSWGRKQHGILDEELHPAQQFAEGAGDFAANVAFAETGAGAIKALASGARVVAGLTRTVEALSKLPGGERAIQTAQKLYALSKEQSAAGGAMRAAEHAGRFVAGGALTNLPHFAADVSNEGLGPATGKVVSGIVTTPLEAFNPGADPRTRAMGIMSLLLMSYGGHQTYKHAVALGRANKWREANSVVDGWLARNGLLSEGESAKGSFRDAVLKAIRTIREHPELEDQVIQNVQALRQAASLWDYRTAQAKSAPGVEGISLKDMPKGGRETDEAGNIVLSSRNPEAGGPGLSEMDFHLQHETAHRLEPALGLSHQEIADALGDRLIDLSAQVRQDAKFTYGKTLEEILGKPKITDLKGRRQRASSVKTQVEHAASEGELSRYVIERYLDMEPEARAKVKGPMGELFRVLDAKGADQYATTRAKPFDALASGMMSGERGAAVAHMSRMKRNLESGKLPFRPRRSEGIEGERMIHYSDTEGITELDPSFYGKSGVMSYAERERGQGGVFLGSRTRYSERQVEGRKHVYETTEPIPYDKVYDAQGDPDGIVAKVTQGKLFAKALSDGSFTAALKDAGYMGWTTGDPRTASIYLLHDKVPVQPADRAQIESGQTGYRNIRAGVVGTFANEGHTWNPHNKFERNTDSGYSVGGVAPTEYVDKSDFTPDRVSEYVGTNKAMLDPEGRRLGSWLNPETGKVELDVTDLKPDLHEAMVLARQRGEKAIGHLGEGGEYLGTLYVDDYFKDHPEPRSSLSVTQHLTGEEIMGLEGPRTDLDRKLTTVQHMFESLPSGEEVAALSEGGMVKRGWYRRAAQAIDSLFGPDAERFTALVSASSPRQPIQSNLKFAARMWRLWDTAGRPTDPHYVETLARRVYPGGMYHAWGPATVRALTLENPGEAFLRPKTSAFYRNLTGELNAVTLDAHEARKLGITEQGTPEHPRLNWRTKEGYLAGTAKLREAADRLGIKPAEAQETGWTTVKTLSELAADHPGQPISGLVKTVTDRDLSYSPEFATVFSDPTIARELRGMGLDVQDVKFDAPAEPLDVPIRDLATDPQAFDSAMRRFDTQKGFPGQPSQFRMSEGIGEEPWMSKVKTEDGKVVMGMDKNLIDVLRSNLYPGRKDVLTIKETLQNAIDAVRPVFAETGKGEVNVKFSGDDKTFEITDTGHGMPPEVVQREFVDAGASLKRGLSSGGYGIAKVLILGNSEDFALYTVYKDPSTGKATETALLGSGHDLLDPEAGAQMYVREVSPDTPTGTRLSLKMMDDVTFSDYEMQSWAAQFLGHSDLPFPINIESGDKYGGGPVKPSTWHGGYEPVSKVIETPGAKVELSLATKSESSGGNVTLRVLNRGMHQFSEDVWGLPDVDLPKGIRVNVEPTVPVTDPNYPFTADRSGLKDDVSSAVKDYVKKNVALDSALREKEKYRKALFSAPQIKGAGTSPIRPPEGIPAPGEVGGLFPGEAVPTHAPQESAAPRIVDATGADSTELTTRMANDPRIREIASTVREVVTSIQTDLAHAWRDGGDRYMKAYFHGFGISPASGGWLGVNIRGDAVTGDPVHYNPILIDLFSQSKESEAMAWGIVAAKGLDDSAHPEVMKDLMAEQIVSTSLHEVTHQVARNEGVDFSGALTRNIGHTVKKLPGYVEAVRRQLDTSLEAINEYSNEHSNLQQPFGAGDLFGKVGTKHETGEADARGQGGLGSDGEGRPGLETAGLPSEEGMGANPPRQAATEGGGLRSLETERGRPGDTGSPGLEQGRPAGVQPWSWNGDRANPYGSVDDGSGGLRPVTEREFVDTKMTGPKRGQLLDLYRRIDETTDPTERARLEQEASALVRQSVGIDEDGQGQPSEQSYLGRLASAIGFGRKPAVSATPPVQPDTTTEPAKTMAEAPKKTRPEPTRMIDQADYDAGDLGSKIRTRDLEAAGEERGITYRGTTYRSWEEARAVADLMDELGKGRSMGTLSKSGQPATDAETILAAKQAIGLLRKMDEEARLAAEARGRGDHATADAHDAVWQSYNDLYEKHTQDYFDVGSNVARALAVRRMAQSVFADSFEATVRNMEARSRRPMNANQREAVKNLVEQRRKLGSVAEAESTAKALEATESLIEASKKLRGKKVTLEDIRSCL